MSPFKSTDLPGIGRRYAIELAGGDMLVVIAHHTGEREIYLFDDPDADDPDSLVRLTDEESRHLGTVLLGADYQPIAEDRMQMLLNEVRITWLRVCDASPLNNQRLRESEVRTRTGVTVIGIKRGDQLIGAPDPDEVLLAGDLLMVIGNSDQVKGLQRLCAIDGN